MSRRTLEFQEAKRSEVRKSKSYIISSLLIIGAFVTINFVGFFTGILDAFSLAILFLLFFITTIIVAKYQDHLEDVSLEKWGTTFRKYSHLSGGAIMLVVVLISSIQLSLICLSMFITFLLHEYFYVRRNIVSLFTVSLIFIGRLDRKKSSNTSSDRKPFFPTLWLLGSIAIIGLFGQSIALAAVIAFAFGDFLSTIVGERIGKHKLPYNKSKSIEGSIAFFGITFLGVSLSFFFLGVSLSFFWNGYNYLFAALVAASVGSISESIIPTGHWFWDDNFVVPVSVSVALFLVSIF